MLHGYMYVYTLNAKKPGIIDIIWDLSALSVVIHNLHIWFLVKLTVIFMLYNIEQLELS